MFKILCLCLLILCCVGGAFSQQAPNEQLTVNLEQVVQISPEANAKIEAACAAMDAVQRTGYYVQSLSDLFKNKEVPLPVGIRNGAYDLIIHKIEYDPTINKPVIYATCAFRFRDNGQKIVFEGRVVLEGEKGLGTRGTLTLVAPVRRNIGRELAIVINEGTTVQFGCDGIESFMAKMLLFVTSEKIIAVDQAGNPTHKPIATAFEAAFHDFDDYSVSLNLNQSFMIKGMTDLIFTLKGATLDQSELVTSSMVPFPAGYFSSADPQELNLWKGLAVTEATLSLPAIFKKSDLKTEGATLPAANDRIVVGLKNVLLDEHGFTANAGLVDIINSQSLDRSKWSVSLNNFLLAFLKNDLVGFGFGGDMNLPPFGKKSLLPYTATFNPTIQEYEFRINIVGKYDFPVLRSSLVFNETSTIEVLLKGSDIYPTINASGMITVDAPMSDTDSTKKFSVPDIPFQNLRISREKPYLSIGNIAVSGDIRSPKIAGFELSIADIQPFSNNTGTGLYFDAGISLNDMFGGSAGLLLYGDYAHWKFDRVEVGNVHVDFKSKAFSVLGDVVFKRGDLLYGDGFRGDVTFTLLEKFELAAIGVFGTKDNYRYFLTDVMFELPPPSGIPVAALSFYGFGGGLYHRMQQTKTPGITSDFGKSKSGINYIPDKTVGMGFMASTKFAMMAAPSTFNAQVGFEIQFNQYGGLNFVQLRGDASFMDDFTKFGKLADNIKKLEVKNEIKPAVKEDLSIPENKNSGFLTASVNITYDLKNSAFSADLRTYLDVAGVIKGTGENDCLGYASAYFSPGKWFVRMGTPKDRMGVKVLNFVDLTSYFMLGHDMPDLPPPPPKVLNNFSQEKRDKLNNRSNVDFAGGNGIAFGASLEIKFKATLPPFYAQFEAGVGAEFLLINKGKSAYCVGRSGTMGINGWYASAQAWAYVGADIGIEAKIFRSRRKFSILSLSASTLLGGEGPNPLYFEGAVGGRFSVMGGLISGQCNFEFEIGEKCKTPTESPFDEKIIAQLTPSAGEQDVNVFTAPQVIFNIPIGFEMPVDEEDGGKSVYKVELKEFTVKYKKTGVVISGYKQQSTDGLVYMLDPSEPFESQQELEVYAMVEFMRKQGNQWVVVKGGDGKPLFEEERETFITGDRPKEIMPQHVKYSYPINRQYNYYPDEHKNGYVMVSKNYSYLFTSEVPEGFDQVLMLTDAGGKTDKRSFSFTPYDAGNDIRLEINFSLEDTPLKNNEIYKIAIVNVPRQAAASITSNVTSQTTRMDKTDDVNITTQQAEESLTRLGDKEILAWHFRVSKYNRFSEKMSSFNVPGGGWRDPVELFVHHIKTNITDDEFFDKYEIQWLNGEKPLIQMEAQLNETNWYTGSIYKSMYQNHTEDEIVAERKRENERFSDFGFPPAMSVKIANLVDDRTLTDDEINTKVPAGTFAAGIFVYPLPYWCIRDFIFLKNKVGRQAISTGIVSAEDAKLLATDFPPVVTKGFYPVRMQYVLPGKNIITDTVNVNMYNPIE